VANSTLLCEENNEISMLVTVL